MVKVTIKERAFKLRQEGYSYNLIAEKLSVSKSTLSVWLSQMPYTPNEAVIRRIGKARAAMTKAKQDQKLSSYNEAAILARADIGKVEKRDLFMIGLALYIGEGEKNQNVGIINADPRIILTTMRWLQKCYGVPQENFTLAIHLYSDNNRSASLQYWSEMTNIPLALFGKTQIDLRPNKKDSKRGKLPHGTAHLRVRSLGNKQFGVLLSRRIKAAADIVLQQ
jgi:transcriptional regulator with XRE-family HTH domain